MDLEPNSQSLLNRIIANYKEQNSEERNNKDIDKIAYTIFAIIGVELERKFGKFFNNTDSKNEMYGRKKSDGSYEKKQQDLINEFHTAFITAFQKGDDLPTSIYPITDNFAFRLVCQPLIDINTSTTVGDIEDNYNLIITAIIDDFLSMIKKESPEYTEKVMKYMSDNQDPIKVANFINTYLSTDSHDDTGITFLKLITSAQAHKNAVVGILNFINNNPPLDTTSCTYKEWYDRMLSYYGILAALSYKKSTNEQESITEDFDEKVISKIISQLKESGLTNDIDVSSECSNNELIQLLIECGLMDYKIGYNFNSSDKANSCQIDFFEHELAIKRIIYDKLTNKLDLDLLSLMFLDVLNTSTLLKDHSVSISNIKGDDALKRRSNGYISNFFILFIEKLNCYIEFQLQSFYRYLYQLGPAAHNQYKSDSIENTLEETFTPETMDQINENLPHFFQYIGNGVVKFNSWYERFQRLYSDRDDFNTLVQNNLPTLIQYLGTQIFDSPELFALDYTVVAGQESKVAQPSLGSPSSISPNAKLEPSIPVSPSTLSGSSR